MPDRYVAHREAGEEFAFPLVDPTRGEKDEYDRETREKHAELVTAVDDLEDELMEHNNAKPVKVEAEDVSMVRIKRVGTRQMNEET